jgi:hypothetical protein
VPLFDEVTSNSSSNSPKQYIPQINFSSLDSLSQDEIEKIKRRGSVLIRDVVDDAQAVEWKNELKEFVKVNDERGVEGIHSQFKRTLIYIKSS